MGSRDGQEVGFSVGKLVGSGDGTGVGLLVGKYVGSRDGAAVGLAPILVLFMYDL